MKTTEGERPARSRPVLAGDLRPSVLALLATGYLIVFWALAVRAPRAAASPGLSMSPAPVEPGRTTVWYADLPPRERPALRLPPGWSVATASDAAAASDARPRMVRVSPARAGRVRTRSS